MGHGMMDRNSQHPKRLVRLPSVSLGTGGEPRP